MTGYGTEDRDTGTYRSAYTKKPAKLVSLRIPLKGRKIPDKIVDVLQECLQDTRLGTDIETYEVRGRRLGIFHFVRPEFLRVDIHCTLSVKRDYYDDDFKLSEARDSLIKILNSANFQYTAYLECFMRPNRSNESPLYHL